MLKQDMFREDCFYHKDSTLHLIQRFSVHAPSILRKFQENSLRVIDM